jgi:predicted secreted protein
MEAVLAEHGIIAREGNMEFTKKFLAVAAAALVLALAGCAGQSEQTSENVTPSQAPAASERMAYSGTVNGNSATIVFDPADNEFIMLETVPGTAAGTTTQRRTTGHWTSARGTGADANYTVYEVMPAEGGAPMRFVVTSENEIRMTGPDNAVVTFMKTSVPDASAMARWITPADAGTTVKLEPGEEIVLMLPVSAQGQSWTWSDSTSVPLQRIDPPSSSPNMQSSATGQAIAFKATQQGNGQLKLTAPPGAATTPREFMVTIVVE